MNSDARAKNYLFDLGTLLREKAFEAKRSRQEGTNEDYHIGRLMAYYEVVSLMIHQAEVFGIELSEINLTEIDPDRDLL